MNKKNYVYSSKIVIILIIFLQYSTFVLNKLIEIRSIFIREYNLKRKC